MYTDKLKLTNGRIADKQEYDSDISIIVVSEYHYKKDVQLDVFSILTELRRKTGFDLLLLEGFPQGEMDWSDYAYRDVESLREFYGDLTKDLAGRDRKWIGGAPFFAYQNRHTIQTRGAEEKERPYEEHRAKDKRCEELSLEAYREGLESLTEAEQRELKELQDFVREVIIKKRSGDFVDTTIDVMRKLSKKVTVFNVGDAHRDSMIERLRELEISYIWACPNSFDNYTIPMFYLIERKRDL